MLSFVYFHFSCAFITMAVSPNRPLKVLACSSLFVVVLATLCSGIALHFMKVHMKRECCETPYYTTAADICECECTYNAADKIVGPKGKARAGMICTMIIFMVAGGTILLTWFYPSIDKWSHHRASVYLTKHVFPALLINYMLVLATIVAMVSMYSVIDLDAIEMPIVMQCTSVSDKYIPQIKILVIISAVVILVSLLSMMWIGPKVEVRLREKGNKETLLENHSAVYTANEGTRIEEFSIDNDDAKDDDEGSVTIYDASKSG